MCGRYILSRADEIRERFFADTDGLDLQPCYNVCPDRIMPVIVSAGNNRLEMMKWGLIPFWSKEPKSLAINARAEEILNKPSFRKPIRFARCLIPATGYYEWKKEGAGKTPFHIRRKDGRLFAFAGIFDTWSDPELGEVKTFAIITKEANEAMAQVHNRMPVILTPKQENLWLTTEPGKTGWLLDSLGPLPQDEFEMYPVAKAVNFAKNDWPGLIDRLKPTVRPIVFPPSV